MMDEHVVAAILLDKAETLGVVEPLDSTYCHLYSPPFCRNLAMYTSAVLDG